jgi:hypothetical protein
VEQAILPEAEREGSKKIFLPRAAAGLSEEGSAAVANLVVRSAALSRLAETRIPATRCARFLIGSGSKDSTVRFSKKERTSTDSA